MNHWVYRPRRVSQRHIQAAIEKKGMQAARDPATGEWFWVRVVENSPVTFETVRPCSAKEVERLTDLLKGEVICRMRRDDQGNSWAFASRT